MALAAVRHKYEALHNDQPWHDGTFTLWADKRSDDYPFHYLDGVEIWVSPEDLTPEDDFLGTGRPHQESNDEAEHPADPADAEDY